MNILAVKEFLDGRVAKGRTMSALQTRGGLALFSYDEPIAMRQSKRHLMVELEWKYSRTTMCHRRLLLKHVDTTSVDLTPVSREEIRLQAGLDPVAPPPRIYTR